MTEILGKGDAIKFLGLEEKTFENYFQNAGEFNPLPRPGDRGRILFSKAKLETWLENYRWRTIELTSSDYALCLDFALAQHFRGYVLSDWGTARQREFGQKITNWVKGQLAEVAVKKFFEKEFGLIIELDFEIRPEIVPQDITWITEDSKKREPRIKIGIKSSKPKSAYLILGENEVVLPERRSDVYIFCRPDIPDDHLLRITKDRIIEVVKDQQHFDKYRGSIPDFSDIPCEVAGWCEVGKLERVTSIPGQEFDGTRFVKKSGQLLRSRKDWENLLSRL